MHWQDAEILEVKPLSNTIIQVLLKPQHYQAYVAGQYLQVKTTHYENYFSIANAPMGNPFYELHIRHDESNPSSIELLQEIKAHHLIKIKLPFGKCSLAELIQDRPIIFIAGGTGFAPIKAMIEMMLFQNDPRKFECYWGAKTKSDLYWQQALNQYQLNTPSFQHVDAIVDGDILEQVLKQHPQDLKDYQIVLSGPFDMVFHFQKKLLAQGILQKYLHADAFEF